MMSIARTALLALLLIAAPSASASSPDRHAFLRGLQEDDCTDCMINGVGYCLGESYPNPTCLPNTCSCGGDMAMAPCTMMACERSCDDKAVCTHDGNYYCEGDQFYDTTCMPNTCSCKSDGQVACTRMACFEECSTDEDCEAVVRNETAQPDLNVQCACEARSTDEFIAGKFDQCLGDGIKGDGINDCESSEDCGDTCQDWMAVCSQENKCTLAYAPADKVTTTDACASDMRECDDGTFVNRDPSNDCAFKDCPEDVMCAGDVEDCGNGVYVARNSSNGCAFDPCPDDIATDAECEEGCLHNGICHNAGDNYTDACNSCTCSGGPDNLAICTEMACECTACEANNETYCVGETYLADDGCNTCTCGAEDGTAKCTKMACEPLIEPEPTTCENNGIIYNVGDSFLNQCNNCDCTENGAVCQLMACECTACEDKYCVDEVYLAEDGCNTCTCGSENGTALCTQMACPPEPEPTTCEHNGIIYNVGDSFLNQCNNCDCTEQGAVCTLMACECTACEDKYCVDEVFLAEDGCNTCSCGSEDGVAMCTLMECPPEPTCENNGIIYNVGDSFLNECNNCDCTENGAVCTLMACECSACKANNETYCVDEVFLAEDGCNTCTCGSEGGAAVCTQMSCPDTVSVTTVEPMTCENNGIVYNVGESFLNQCNTCDCTENGAACTKKACECTACEDKYCVDEVFLAEDGCNTCTCGSEDGAAACTQMACPPEPTCENNGIIYNVGDSFQEQCNTCDCTENGAACTKKACDCTACEGKYCVDEVFLAEDGCNTCTCGSEDGDATCTQMACPEPYGGDEPTPTNKTTRDVDPASDSSTASATVFNSGHAVLMLFGSVVGFAMNF